MPPPVVKPGDWKDDRFGQRVWVPTIGLGEGGGHRSPQNYDPTVAQRTLNHFIGATARMDIHSGSRSAPSSPAAAWPANAPRNPRAAWQQLHQTPPERMQKQSYSYGAGAYGGYSEPQNYRYPPQYSQPPPLQNYGGYQGSSSSHAYGAPQQHSSPQYRSYGPPAPPQQQMEYGRQSYGSAGGNSMPSSFLSPLAPYGPPPRGPRGPVLRGNTISGPPPPYRSHYGGRY